MSRPGYAGRPLTTRGIMLIVCACLLPGVVLQGWLLSPAGVALNVAAALTAALVSEQVCLRLRGGLTGQHTLPGLADPAALVTALILAAALPPDNPAPAAFAAALAISLGKHAYGGLGGNVFNPAMVGYAIVLVSFPAALADWPQSPDGLTGATALTTFKYRGGSTVEGIWTEANGFGTLGGRAQEWLALAYALGGIVLIGLRVAAWRPAAGMLLALSVFALLGYDGGSSASLGSPAYHLTTGGTALAAFFVLTDPVTHPTSHRGQWLFGLLVGTLVLVIRSWGNYPDGIAFAVLLGNALTPYLDRRLSLGSEPGHG